MAHDISSVDYLTRSVDRNRYFYGKLMTVRDFLREQEYFNSKRWLINRLLFGSGIVCGLEVSSAGGASTVVEIEPGVAFDASGREITVVTRETVDLANLVTADVKPATPAGEKELLVCLEYRECPKEPVPSLKGSPCDEVCESNRIGETFTVGLLNAPAAPAHTTCENWLNRQSISLQSENFDVLRTSPVWVRQNEVFEVAVKVTARNDVTNVTLSEAVTGATFIEPTPTPPSQFPTTPVSLRRGEFFVYIYQVQVPAATTGGIQISGGAGIPMPSTNIQVVTDAQANDNEGEMRLADCLGDAMRNPVPVARIRAVFAGGNLTAVQVTDTFNQQRFRYNLSRVAELLDCVRTSLQAEAESPRPGHSFITFKDVEREDLRPIGPAADHGKAYTVTRGDHVHALLLYTDSGLLFEDNKLRIEGDSGGERINFLHPVSGQEPLTPRHLATKNYVDTKIAGLDWQESVKTQKLWFPPDANTPGDRYLVAPKPDDAPRLPRKNPWADNVGNIATWNGKAWEFAVPDEGTAVFVDDENRAYLFVDGKWIQFLATPDVAAGQGLRADGAVISVGQGPGLKVNENDVELNFEANFPQPVGPTPSAGASTSPSRGDHTHELPLAPLSGLVFRRRIGPGGPPERLIAGDRIDLRGGLQIDGQVGGANIDFRNPVRGQMPVEPSHLATKQYVDGVAAGLDWQNSVLTKGLPSPPPSPTPGARYLIYSTTGTAPSTTPPTSGTEGPAESLITRIRPVESLTAGKEPPATDVSAPTDPTTTPPIFIPPPPPGPDPVPPEFNPWAGHENSIATWNGSDWEYTPPEEGKAVFVEDENTTYLFVDGRWTPFMAMPSVAAGRGLSADGPVLSVGQGHGLRVNDNDVDVVYELRSASAVGQKSTPGVADTAARGDHTHELPLAYLGGLEFSSPGRDLPPPDAETSVARPIELPSGAPRLRINGPVNGDAIDFQYPVYGRDPVDPRHLATKQYVDGVVAGLTWQRTVLDKDLAAPPAEPQRGDRYLLFVTPTAGTPWEGRQDTIATWGGRRWDFTAPSEGMATFVADENLAYLFADGKWVQFLAPPQPVGAGDGLIRLGADLAVGRGEGIDVSPDAVSVIFGETAPMPIGTAGLTGGSRQAAQSDHTHELPLAAEGGLEFTQPFRKPPVYENTSSAPATSESIGPIILRPRLRINGPVNGENIEFQFPVFGQYPVDPRHLATKQYVDERGGGGGTIDAGDGLFIKENVISVGGGPGIVVGPDEVMVNFESGELVRPVGDVSHPGEANTVARGDHTHAMPDVWRNNSSTGVCVFDLRSGPQRIAISLAIDPGIGGGPINVTLGLEGFSSDAGVLVGPPDRFTEITQPPGLPQRFPLVTLAANIFPADEAKEARNSSFEIWARAAGGSTSALPDLFRVRWWAYRGGKDMGETVYDPRLG